MITRYDLLTQYKLTNGETERIMKKLGDIGCTRKKIKQLSDVRRHGKVYCKLDWVASFDKKEASEKLKEYALKKDKTNRKNKDYWLRISAKFNENVL